MNRNNILNNYFDENNKICKTDSGYFGYIEIRDTKGKSYTIKRKTCRKALKIINLDYIPNDGKHTPFDKNSIPGLLPKFEITAPKD